MLAVAQVCRIGAPHVGGMERVVAGLSTALAARGHRVEVVTLDRAVTTGEVLSDGIFEGVRYHRLPRIGPRRYPFARGLRDAVGGFDLVHVHGLDGLADTLVRGTVPVGISTHGGYFHTPRHRLLKQLALRTVTARTLRRADAVWYTSEADRRTLAAAGVDGPVLLDGVDTARFEGVHRRPVPGRWLVYGRVDVHKGLDDLLSVLARVTVPFRVDVAGSEARRGLLDGLRRQAIDLGLADRVRIHGQVPEAKLRDLVGRAELALFPSRYEGFGLTVVELAAAGVPPVVGPIPAYDALVTHGVDGWLVPWREPGAADALAALYERDHREIGSRARQRALTHGWTRRVLDYEAAYLAVLERRGSPCGSA